MHINVMCIRWGKGVLKVRVVSGYSGRGFYGSVTFLACLLEL